MTSDERYIFLLSKAQHKLLSYLKKSMAAEGLRITSVQTGILFLLKKQPMTMTELSKELQIDNSAITGLVDRLEKSDFVRRELHPNDRRTFNISITPKGLDEIERAKPVVRQVNDKIKEGFSDEEMEVFKKILNSFFSKFEYSQTIKN